MRSALLNRLFFVTCMLLSSAAAANINQGDSADTNEAKGAFSFNDIFDPAYRPRSFSVQWIDGTDEFLYRNSSTLDIMRFNAVHRNQTVFMKSSKFAELNATTYLVSHDLRYVLFAYDTAQLWRHSFTGKYILLDLTTGALIPFPQGSHANETLQYAGWASKENSALTFVVGNNLYYQASPSSPPDQITSDGDTLLIYNGVPDWLYEEDVLGSRVTHYPSSDGKFVCYAQLNDTEVPLQAWPWYGEVDDVYGSLVQIPYPKAGDVTEQGTIGPNTRVKMFVYDVAGKQSHELLPPAEDSLLKNGYYYIQAAWLDNEHVMITWANRVQNESWSVIYNASQPNSPGVVHQHFVERNGWVEVPPTKPWPIDNGQSYLTIQSHSVDGAVGSWRHLAVVNITANGTQYLPTYKTSEEVQEIVGYDDAKKTVYYISTGGDPTERHLFQFHIGVDKVPMCLTCGSESCRYVAASFSSTSQYFILGCRGPEIPVYLLKDLANVDNNGFILENNDAFRTSIGTKLVPTREFIPNLSLGNTGYTGRAEVFYPPGHVEGNSYPLLVFVYGGPGSQRVMKTYPFGGSTNNWLRYLGSSHNVVIASLDGRGTAAAGDDYKFQMYRKLSVVEIEDQLSGGEYFNQLKQVNASLPSAIFGWSYGGGVAAHVTGDVSQTFKCGISVAPVTTKAYYDTAYTERYLGFATPDDNAAGYEATNVMNKAKNFKDKEYLIAHGTSDDNVHFMHAAHLVRALSDAGIQFRQNMYVDQNHGISKPSQSQHLYATMTNFLIKDCWKDRTTYNGAATSTNSLSAFALISLVFLSLASHL